MRRTAGSVRPTTSGTRSPRRSAGRPGPASTCVVYFECIAACGGHRRVSARSATAPAPAACCGPTGTPRPACIGHELGHNLGLGHSQELDCTARRHPHHGRPRSLLLGAVLLGHQRHHGRVVVEPGLPQRLAPAPASGSSSPAQRVAPTDEHHRHPQAPRRQPRARGCSRCPRRAPRGTSWSTAPRPGSTPGCRPTRGWGAPGVTVRREFDQKSCRPASSFPPQECFLLDGDPATDDPSFGHTSHGGARWALGRPGRRARSASAWCRSGRRCRGRRARRACGPDRPRCFGPRRCDGGRAEHAAAAVRTGAVPRRAVAHRPGALDVDGAVGRRRVRHPAQRPHAWAAASPGSGSAAYRAVGGRRRRDRGERDGHRQGALLAGEGLGRRCATPAVAHRARAGAPGLQPAASTVAAQRGYRHASRPQRRRAAAARPEERQGRDLPRRPPGRDGRPAGAGSHLARRTAWVFALPYGAHTISRRQPEQGHAASGSTGSSSSGLSATSPARPTTPAAGADGDRLVAPGPAGWGHAQHRCHRDRGELRQRQPRRRPPRRPGRGRRGQRRAARRRTATTPSPRRRGRLVRAASSVRGRGVPVRLQRHRRQRRGAADDAAPVRGRGLRRDGAHQRRRVRRARAVRRAAS